MRRYNEDPWVDRPKDAAPSGPIKASLVTSATLLSTMYVISLL